MGTVVGVVERVVVYPVKSLGGRPVPAARVEAGGLVGDRAHTVVDAATGERVTVKQTPRLGEVLATGDVEADTATLTAVLGRPVRLAASDEGPRVDAAPVHLVSRQSLDRAAAGEVPVGCSAEDPRANLQLTLDEGDERTWVGRELHVGEAVLRLTRLPKHCLGVYAEVVRPGAVAVGDAVSLGDPEQAAHH
ncbi:MOSC N-terminal beta barrel domain-containing protein [Blastococcus sp. URHD0036]|uniref:MOSC N-terminal beta barrel domain-containing protein n=1 Tax=Blastococcus sp. URHD0036 TaxID=1380356 RepID=UPI001E2B39FC|nr:MOSC domain-containing protein [Blastococcus sp. URHD0036]